MGYELVFGHGRLGLIPLELASGALDVCDVFCV